MSDDNVDVGNQPDTSPTGTPEPQNWYNEIGLEADYVTNNQASFDKFKDVGSVVKSGIEASKKINELTGEITNLKSDIPQAPDEYDFGEATIENSEMWTSAFKDANITNEGANKLVSAFNDLQEQARSEAFSKEGLESIIPEAKRNELNPILKENLSSDDLQAIDKLPNEMVGLAYRIAESFANKYGAKEGDSLAGTTTVSQDLDKAYDDKYNEIISYGNQMIQDPAQKARLVEELNSITAQKMKRG